MSRQTCALGRPGQPSAVSSPPAANITVSRPGHDGDCAQAPIHFLHARDTTSFLLLFSTDGAAGLLVGCSIWVAACADGGGRRQR